MLFRGMLAPWGGGAVMFPPVAAGAVLTAHSITLALCRAQEINDWVTREENSNEVVFIKLDSWLDGQVCALGG